MIPSPAQLLQINRFNSWYPNQERIVSEVLSWINGDGRFMGLSAPTGSGKSLTAIMAAKLSGKRTVVLTATKGLQDQIIKDFARAGVVNVKGQNNFACTMSPELRADEGPCRDGLSCSYKSAGCRYYEQLEEALTSEIVVTNYAYYLAQTRHSSGIGDIGLLIMDEANLAFSALESHLQIRLGHADVGPMGIAMTKQEQSWEEWQSWAANNTGRAKMYYEELETRIKECRSTGQTVSSSISRSFRVSKSILNRLAALASAAGPWVVSRIEYASGWVFTPVWVANYGHLLFGDASKVLLMSALLSPKTLDIIGVPPDRRWLAMGSTFPAANTPIWHVPTARINQRTDDYGMTIWIARIDQIISRRLNRKGIIFTVSYKRRDLLLQRSKFADIMFSHGTRDVVEMVNRFKSAKPPAVLISPSVTSGWDFPDDDCRYIIIGKIPYPDTTDPVLVARQESDKDWSSFVAMETLVQEAGRGTRSSADKCEVLVVDDSWKWYWPRYRPYAPQWFQDRVLGSLNSVPDPLISID